MLPTGKSVPPKEPTYDRILATASAQILKKGIRDTSLADIAKSIKISKGTLYYHFRSKDSLIEEIARKNFEEVAERIVLGLKDLKPKKGSDIVDVTLSALTSEPQNAKLLHFIWLEILTGNRKLGFKIIKVFQQTKETITTALLPFCKTKEDAILLSGMIIALAEGINLGDMLGTNELEATKVVKFLKV